MESAFRGDEPDSSGGVMSTIQKHQQTLSEWLDVATKQLTVPAKERIQLEIEGHYAEAVNAHLAAGLSEPDAQTMALAELGNARAAARRFRKRHLTEREAEKVEQAVRWAGNLRWLLLGYIMFACAPWLFRVLHRGKPDYISIVVPVVVGLLAGVIIPTACFISARRKRPNMHLLFLIPEISASIWLFSLLLYTKGPTFDFWLFGFCCLPSIRGFRIWYKLWRMGEYWPEIPFPRGTASC
jgi:cation transport ATPase